MNNKVESAFYKTIMEGVAKYVKKNTPTYATAKVVSIDEDGTPYVQFPGAETTTPVTTVTNAAKGDEVLVQVNSNGDAYVYGNLTDQPVSKVEIDKITENTTNVLEKFDYSIQEILDKIDLDAYVKIGESNVPILSNILKFENDILDIQNGEEGLIHLRVTTEGLELGNYYEQYGLNSYVFFSKDGFGRIGPAQTGVSYGQFSLSVGLGRATGQFSLATGPSATASQVGAFAHGTATASGYLSFAANVSTATGAISSSFGNSTASGDYSFSEGSGTNANGHAVHAEGINTNAYGSATHVEGDSNTVYGSAVHGEGRSNTIYDGGDSEHIEGFHNSLTPYGSYSLRPNHIEGMDNTATGAEYLHIEGYGHSITGSSAVHVEGWVNTNLQNLSYSHIEGQTNRASGSSVIHVEGLTNSIMNSSQTHVEGLNNTVSSSNNSHIEGLRNTVSNSSETHVEGLNNNVIASGSFVGGTGNIVSGTEEHEYGFGGDGSTNSFDIGTDWSEILYVKIDGVEIEEYGYPISYRINDGRYIVFYNSINPDDSAPADESLIKVNVLKTGISRNGIFIHALNGVAQYSHQSILGYYNDNKSDTLLEIGNGRSASGRGNAFEVTNDGFIRTGVGTEKIAFGKNQSNIYGYYKGDGTFVPWVTQDTTYTAGTNIDITNNVISAPNVAPIVNGKVPEQYLPSYVDDVIEGYYYNGSFYEDDQHQELITPERGKIYISLDTDKSYRWNGSVYVELTSGGVVYTAGDGIDISNGVISVNNTIARASAIPDELADLADDSTHRLVTDTEKSTWNGKQNALTAGAGIDISNNVIWADNSIARLADVPDELADLEDDSTHRLVTDTEKSTWNGKQGALTAGTGIALSSANTISIKYYGAHAEAASGGANNSKREGMADSGDGMFLTGSYNDSNAPYTYGNIININGTGTGQLFLGWRGDSNTGPLYYRSHRDSASAAWGAWKQIAYTSDIPSVGNGTLTIQKNGTNVQTFTANQSGNATANIVVPFDYNATTVKSGDQGFTGAPHYGVFSDESSVGKLMDDDGVYMFLPYQTNSNSYGFVLACNDDGNQFYLGSLTGDEGSAINWSRIYHDNYHPLAGKADFIKFPRNVVDYNTAMRSRAAETVAFDELSGTTGKPSYISTFTNPWFNLITMHSADANFGSQLAIPMTGFTAPAWRYYAGGNFGSWEYIPSADALSVGSSSTPVYLENGKLKTISSGYLPLAGGTMSAGAKITFTNSATEDGIYLNNGSYQLRLIIGTGGVNRGLWDGSRWMIYENETDVTLNSPGSLILNNNTVINHTEGNWISGLRINSVAGNANGSAHITFGGPSGSYTGTNNSYPMYQIGKTSSKGGAFFLNSRISGVERVLMYGHNAGLQFYSFDQTKQVDIQNDGIRTRTNKLYLHGKDNNYSDGSGEPSSPLILDGFESGQITANSSENTNVNIASTGDELVLVFLSAASDNSFYAVRLLRNNNGTLQTINLASNGTSIATISLNVNQTNYITIKNTSSSYRLYYKILKLS